MASVEDRDPAGKAPAPGLLILTGASHTGKTSVAQEVLQIASPPAAFLSVDNILRVVLACPPGDMWAQIPLAYELLRPQVAKLLDRGWLVVFESTFTYVPDSGAPELHMDALEDLIGAAAERGVPWIVAQLSAGPDEIASRAAATSRLPHDTVARTIELHDSAPLPYATLKLDTGAETPVALAPRLLHALGQIG